MLSHVKFWAALSVAIAGSGLAMTAFGQAAPVAPIVACDALAQDVIVFNRGTEPLPVGTKLHWEVPFLGDEGEVVLEEELVPFVGLYLVTVTRTYLMGDKPCLIKVVTDEAAPA